MWKCNVHERHSLARGGGGDRLTEYWCSENISLFRARFSRSNMLLSLALLLGISTAISSLPQPWFGLFFCIFVIVDCFDLSIFYYTVKSFYTLTSTFWSWDLPPRIENRTNKKHCHLLSSSTMVWSYSANIVITNQEAREIIKHCQRHNGPEDWVLLTKVTYLGHITSSYTYLDQTSSESWPRTNFKILTKPWNLVLKVWTKT